MENYIKNLNIKLNEIKQHPVYKQALADSYGGIIYDVAKIGTYDTKEILKLWSELTPVEKEQADGIMKGVIEFLQEK